MYVGHVKFINVLKIAHKHPQACWNSYPLLREGLDLGLWISSLGCHACANGCNAIFTCVDCLSKVHCFDYMYFRGRGVECTKPSCLIVFLGSCQTVWPA